MTATQIAWAHLKHRAWSTSILLTTMALALASIIVLLLFSQQYERRLNTDVKGIDLVFAKMGDAAAITRQSILHISPPVGQMSLGEVDAVRNNPIISWSVPLYIADNYRGYRIVGTEQKFSFLYKAELEPGSSFWGTPFDAVIGSGVAKRTGLDIGDSFRATHGLTRDGAMHGSDYEYVVTGILQPTGGVIDRLILTSMQSLWGTHGNDRVSALIVRSKDKQALAKFAQQQTDLQSAAPMPIVTAMLERSRQHLKPFYVIAFLLVIASILSIFFTLQRNLAARSSDMAMQRVMGATPKRLFQQIFMEAVILTSIGTIAGFFIGHLIMGALAWFLPPTRGVGLSGFAITWQEIILLMSTLCLGILAGLYPAQKARHVPVAATPIETAL
jgi:putative ABC transport system permease protein